MGTKISVREIQQNQAKYEGRKLKITMKAIPPAAPEIISGPLKEVTLGGLIVGPHFINDADLVAEVELI